MRLRQPVLEAHGVGNGAEKTTLLRVLAGTLTPHEGGIRARPVEATTVYCPQTIDEAGDDVHALAAAFDGAAMQMRGSLLDEPTNHLCEVA